MNVSKTKTMRVNKAGEERRIETFVDCSSLGQVWVKFGSSLGIQIPWCHRSSDLTVQIDHTAPVSCNKNTLISCSYRQISRHPPYCPNLLPRLPASLSLPSHILHLTHLAHRLFPSLLSAATYCSPMRHNATSSRLTGYATLCMLPCK